LPQLQERGIQLWLRPHARHVLADPQSCMSFLSRRTMQPIRLLLEPAAFLTHEMLAHAEDHLARAFEALGSHPGVAAVLLANVGHAPSDDAPLVPAPLHRGSLDPDLVVRHWRRCVPAEMPVALLVEEWEDQRRLIQAVT
jgi:hypothetical protein